MALTTHENKKENTEQTRVTKHSKVQREKETESAQETKIGANRQRLETNRHSILENLLEVETSLEVSKEEYSITEHRSKESSTKHKQEEIRHMSGKCDIEDKE